MHVFPSAGAASSKASAAASRRLALFTVLGYGYLAAIVLLLAGAVVLLGWSSRPSGLVIIPGMLLVLVAKALLSLPSPEGQPLVRPEAPELFDLIDDVRRGVDAPAPHVVLLTTEINAAVAELPRFAVFGVRRFLLLGVPLLHGLPPDELRAVLAHEFAHVSRRHPRNARRRARLQHTWSSLAFSAQLSRGWFAFLFVPFFRWYAPRYAARVEAVQRGEEYESDELAAAQAGRPAAARALARIALLQQYLERAFLPELFAATLERDVPPDDAFARLCLALPDAAAHPSAERWLALLLADRSDEGDSHPALGERLHALGIPSGAGQARTLVDVLRYTRGEAMAAGVFTPDLLRRHGAVLGAAWTEAYAGAWPLRRADARIWTSAAEAGAEAADSHAALLARARWTAAAAPDSALPLLRRAVARMPDNFELRLLLGRALVEQSAASDREDGIRLLEAVLARDSAHAFEAAVTLRRVYASEGRARETERCRRRLRQLRDAALSELRERAGLRFGDAVRPLPVQPATLDTLQRACDAIPELRRAFLVQKASRWFPDSPLTVLAFEVGTKWYRPAFGAAEERVGQALLAAVAIPEAQELVIQPLASQGSLRRRLRALDGALVFDRHAPAVRASRVLPAAWHRPAPAAWALTAPGLTVLFLLLLGGVVAAGRMYDDAERSESIRVAELRHALREDPDNADAARALLLELLRIDRHDDAAAVVADAVRLNPADPQVLAAEGWLLTRERRWHDALPPLEASVALEPGDWFTQANLARTLTHVGRYEDAVAAFEEVNRLAPRQPDAYREKGRVLALLGRTDDALAALHEAVRLRDDAPNQFTLARVLQDAGQWDAAIEAYRALARLESDEPGAWIEIGMIENRRGHHAAAIEALRQAERISPTRFSEHRSARLVLQASLEGRIFDPNAVVETLYDGLSR
jgi:tetratricopeptide (TPR) repeat protein